MESTYFYPQIRNLEYIKLNTVADKTGYTYNATGA
jgi:hypothetical protein